MEWWQTERRTREREYRKLYMKLGDGVLLMKGGPGWGYRHFLISKADFENHLFASRSPVTRKKFYDGVYVFSSRRV